jgi:hypothetical protein
VRRRLTIAVTVIALLAVSGLLLATRGGDDSPPAAANVTGLDNQALSADEVDIDIEPRQLDDTGAVFAVTLDTHSTELSMDLTAAALEVAGTPWPVAGWDGDGPSGHHREGELRFEAAGPATGTARLVLAGFSEPVEVRWELGA